MKSQEFSWENNVYRQGTQLNRYPYDSVVSFVFANRPRQKSREDVRVLELGCGAGNNLWFLSREGFNVSGIDLSETAINYCKDRLESENLKADLRVGDFADIPFENDYFDLLIDRGSISCCDPRTTKKVISESKRVLKSGGKFLFTPYSKSHTSFENGKLLPSGMITHISIGLTNAGDLNFYSKADILNAFTEGWEISTLNHKVVRNEKTQYVHAEWEVVIIKL